MTQGLATQGERHATCGQMVSYGEMHWTDECKPTDTPLVLAVRAYEQAMKDMAQGYREHPRTMDYLSDCVKAETKIADAKARVESAKADIAEAIGHLKDSVAFARR